MQGYATLACYIGAFISLNTIVLVILQVLWISIPLCSQGNLNKKILYMQKKEVTNKKKSYDEEETHIEKAVHRYTNVF